MASHHEAALRSTHSPLPKPPHEGGEGEGEGKGRGVQPLFSLCAAVVLQTPELASLPLESLPPSCPPVFREEVFYMDGRGRRSIEEFVARLDLQGQDEEDEEGEVPDAVLLSTVHQAKGLEWPTVFVPRFNEGFFPKLTTDDRSDNHAELDEERRLAHVAFTRAREKLYITALASAPFSSILDQEEAV